jgi:hypothetical protein
MGELTRSARILAGSFGRRDRGGPSARFACDGVGDGGVTLKS